MPSGQNPSRRSAARVAAPSDLWAFWNCRKQDGLSRVLDLSLGGLGISLDKSERIGLGETVQVNFLAPEGQIRADAVVRHVEPGSLGLKFVALSDEDRPRLTALMMRVRNLARQ
jgi:c-di-GMP-binding flagellar brake protein YcgR